MNTYKRHRFPPDIISYTVWLLFRFNLSHRDIEDLLVELGMTVSHESIQLWSIKFGANGVSRLKCRHQGYGETSRHANNRVEQSHEPTRVRERGMRKFKSVRQAQRFLGAHATVYNLFNLGRHLVSASHYRNLRTGAFNEWSLAVA